MPENVTALCYGCHSYLGSHPSEHLEFQIKRLGKETVEKVIFASYLYVKKDRKAQELYWKNKLKEDFNI